MRAADAAAVLDGAQASAAETGIKAMMPIAGRPFLDYVLHSLAEAGFTDIALVLAPHHDTVREHYGSLHKARVRMSFLCQQEPLGTADALLSAEDWCAGEPFIALNSDNLYPISALAALREAAGPAVPGFERDSLGLPIDRVATFALIKTNAGPEGPRHPCLSAIVEKPGRDAMERAGPRALVSMNVWRFDARIFGDCRDVPRSVRGEKELPQAVGLAASRGTCFEVFPASGPVIDLSSRADVERVTAQLSGIDVRL